MKVAILHDYFSKQGGGERLVLGLAKNLNADIYTGYVDRRKTFNFIGDFNITEICGKMVPKLHNGLQYLIIMNKFSKLKLTGYDLYIYSGTMCISAAKHNKPSLLYCHTPPRFVYDLYGWFMKNSTFLQRTGIKFLSSVIKPLDQKYMRMFDKIMVNSQNVKNRLQTFYGNDIYAKDDVVYSLIDLSKFTSDDPTDYYLSFGRLDKLKRVDLIVEAFQKMPDKKLIVVAGGPEQDNIKKMCEGYNNINFRGQIPVEELYKLISKCIATIYVPVNEDMGLTPIESNAAGKPCIGANEGGLKELIKHGKTGFLIEASVENIVAAVKKIDRKKSMEMRKDCEDWGRNFSEDKFIKRVKDVIRSMGLDPGK